MLEEFHWKLVWEALLKQESILEVIHFDYVTERQISVLLPTIKKVCGLHQTKTVSYIHQSAIDGSHLKASLLFIRFAF
jgi:hypothetical protein